MEDTLRSSLGVRRLATAQVANSIGDGGFYVAGVVVFHELLGLSAAQIGVALTVAWGVGFVLTTPLGRLADRRGLRGAAVVLSLGTAVATAALLATVGPVSFLVVAVGYAVAQSGLQAVRQALVVALVPLAERTAVRARLQMLGNAGIGIGAACGGVALAAATPAAYTAVLLVDAVGFTVSALLTAGLPAVPRVAVAPTRGGAWRDVPYLTLAGLSAVLYLYLPMLSVVLPLFVVTRTPAPDWAVAALFVVNTAGVFALQVRAGRGIDDVVAAAHRVRRGGAVLAASCAVFALAALAHGPGVATAVVLAGGVVQVLGEVWFAAGNWELGFSLADPQRPGEWQGLYSAGIPVARAVGPLLLTLLVVEWSGPGWWVLGAVLLAAAVAVPRAARWAARTRA